MSWRDRHFVNIGGVFYRAALLDRAKALSKAGKLGLQEAEVLWESVLDGPVTATERRTLQRIVDSIALAKDARHFLATKIKNGPRGSRCLPHRGQRHRRGTFVSAVRHWILVPAARVWRHLLSHVHHPVKKLYVEPSEKQAVSAIQDGQSHEGSQEECSSTLALDLQAAPGTASGPVRASQGGREVAQNKSGASGVCTSSPNRATCAQVEECNQGPAQDGMKSEQNIVDREPTCAASVPVELGERTEQRYEGWRTGSGDQLALCAHPEAFQGSKRTAARIISALDGVVLGTPHAIASSGVQPVQCLESPREPQLKYRRVEPFKAIFTTPGSVKAMRLQLVEALSAAKKTLDAALFVLTDERLASVLVARHKAGVQVRVLSDRGGEDAFETSKLDLLREAGIEVRLNFGKRLMHHKFAVVDGALCVSGSMNWTAGALRYNRENVVIHHCREVSRAFAGEFERLWAAFAPHDSVPLSPTPQAVWAREDACAVLFFPDQHDANFKTLMGQVLAAEKSLDVAMFTLGVSELKDALKSAAARGVCVRVITEERQARFIGRGSPIGELRVAGVQVRTRATRGNMHHKFCVVDGATVCSGSFNWTRHAEGGNNENVVIYRCEPDLAGQFSAEFERLWVEFGDRGRL